MSPVEGGTAATRPAISVVIPCYNEEDNVRQIHAAVTREIVEHASSYEIIFIDNCSVDTTRDLIRDVCRNDPNVRAIFNTRNFGQMRSPTYAIYQAEGEAVIAMGADFQDPPALIGPLIAHWRAGAQIVLGQRRVERASIATRFSRRLGYALLGRFADYPVIPNATGFGLFSRECVDVLAAWHEPEPFFRGMVVESGLRIALIPFNRPERAAGETKNNFWNLLDFAVSSLAGSSKSLLRAPLFLSVLVGLVAVGFALALCGALVTPAIAAWRLPLLLIGSELGVLSILLLFIGLVGEQVRIISERTRNVPLVIESERINFPPDRLLPAGRTAVNALTSQR